MNILVVDDESSYRILLSDYLKEQGWNVYAASHGAEGLEKLEKTNIDIIVSDVYMPVMDGLKFHQNVRKIPAFQNIPFLFVSGYDDEYTRGLVKTPKLEGFYKKSAPISELKSWIEFLTTPFEKRLALYPSGPSRGNSRYSPRRDDRPGRR